MEEWQRLLHETITDPEKLARFLDADIDEIKAVHKEFPLRINPYYLSLIEEKGDPIWLQAVPDIREIGDTGLEDPLAEEENSPVPGITHRYPDRVLFYVNHSCATYCRFCTRKRKVANPKSVDDNQIELGIEYILAHPEVRDVVVSGGDPLLLPDKRIEHILSRLRSIPHLEIIRIGTRVPVTLPQRITPELCEVLKKFHPLYLNTHFNHPREITPEATKACAMLADAGIPLGNQSVLLKGVNDDPKVMKKLVQKLLSIRVRPYLVYQADLVKGTDHLRTTVQKGLEVMSALRGFTSGLAVPHYVIDVPGGGGKVAIIPDPVVHLDDHKIVVRNYEGKLFTYENSDDQNKPAVDIDGLPRRDDSVSTRDF
jgi:lysine 2,3-aminomutase